MRAASRPVASRCELTRHLTQFSNSNSSNANFFKEMIGEFNIHYHLFYRYWLSKTYKALMYDDYKVKMKENNRKQWLCFNNFTKVFVVKDTEFSFHSTIFCRLLWHYYISYSFLCVSIKINLWVRLQQA